MNRLATLGALVLACALVLSGCEETGTDGFTTTGCNYPHPTAGSGKAVGEACTQDSECAYNFCMLPGADGNITNVDFGFCSRGCDCGDASSQIQDADDATQECIYPSGFQGKARHAVLECGSVSDCTGVASGWTACGIPDSGTIKTVCLAGDVP